MSYNLFTIERTKIQKNKGKLMNKRTKSPVPVTNGHVFELISAQKFKYQIGSEQSLKFESVFDWLITPHDFDC